MPTTPTASAPEIKPTEDIRELLQKNIQLSETIHVQNRKILRRMTLLTVGSYLRLAILVIPIVIAFIFLPPIIQQYLEALSSISGGGADKNQLQEIISQFLQK